MAVAWPMLRRLIVGAAALVSVTSLACAIAAFRFGSAVEPYVWVENPLGSGLTGSFVWHLLLAALFAAACVLSYHNAAVPTLRATVAAVVGLIALGAAKDAAVFYNLLVAGRIQSHLPVPLSLCVSLLAAGLAICVWHRRSCSGPLWQVISLDLSGGFAGAAALVLMHLVTFGSTDYTRPADVAIVLGAKVYSDGTPSTSLADRLETGIALYRSGLVQYLLMTGGTGVEGCNEALAMREYAIAAGIPPERVLVDTRGVNTLASAKNCRTILVDRGLNSVLLVSHYFHLARCKMVFADQEIRCATVPARMSRRLVYEPFFVLRECVAYPTYCMQRPIR